mgnify:CR=1 FL=1|jgi:hypothetical protein
MKKQIQLFIAGLLIGLIVGIVFMLTFPPNENTPEIPNEIALQNCLKQGWDGAVLRTYDDSYINCAYNDGGYLRAATSRDEPNKSWYILTADGNHHEYNELD